MSDVTSPTPAPPATRARADELLRVLAGPAATLRDDQGQAIGALVDDRARVLLVQATGWGKSAVYWIATKLRREAGAGPTLVVSPLLALMRDQVAAARRLGLHAATINSANIDEWDAITADLDAGRVDVLLISPERLNAPSFRDRLDDLAGRVGLFVVDEAHCISDWGHDFRPDYRRIRDVLAGLPAATPVLACTATANTRVTEDVAAQLAPPPTDRPGGPAGPVRTLRGRLGRDSLRLAVVRLDDAETRLAWLTAYVAGQRPVHGRAGVVYTLTVAEAERTAEFLAGQGLAVASYTSAVPPAEREERERALLANSLDALVATSALGMGYDKPDLAFVIHLGAPSSPVAYYQQVGRAGRAIDHAEVVLLPTGAQEAIWEHFDVAGVPSRREGEELLDRLGGAARSLPSLERDVNLRRSRLELLLKVLDVDGAVRKEGSGWTATGAPWHYDERRYADLVAARRVEHAAMRRLSRGEISGCLMAFLRDALDDDAATACGRCQSCSGWEPDIEPDPEVVAAGRRFLRRRDVVVRPRRRWPSGLGEVKGNIGQGRRLVEGRALAAGDDSGWGAEVAELLRLAVAGEPDGGRGHALREQVVEAFVGVLARWDWSARPRSVVALPSLDTPAHDALVGWIAERIGELGRLPVVPALGRVDGPPQSVAANSAHQAHNALARLQRAEAPLPSGPVLLVCAETGSGWAATVAAWRLTADEPRDVLPLALWDGP